MPSELPATVDYTRSCFKKHLERLYEQHHRELRFTGSTCRQLAQWQKTARGKLADLLAVADAPRPPVLLRCELQSETDTYRREKVRYETFPGVVVPAVLLSPKQDGRRPTVLCPPGHGGGVNHVLNDKDIYKAYPLRLVEQGFVALVPEHAGFGERCGESGKDQAANHRYYWNSLNLLGSSAIGVFLWELQRALDLLESRPNVDPKRIGCWGLSLGGEMTLFLAAMDERIKAACISCFLSSYKSSFLDVEHCGCGYVPGLVRAFEHADIATLIAPRPLLVESSTRDIFPLDAATAAVDELRRVYGLCQASNQIDQDVFTGDHEISGVKAYGWFRTWL